MKRRIARKRAEKSAEKPAETPPMFEVADTETAAESSAPKVLILPGTEPEYAPVSAASEPGMFVMPDEVSPEARAVYDAMTAQPEAMDDLAARIGMSAPEISMLLFELEMNRAVISHPGRRWSRRESDDSEE